MKRLLVGVTCGAMAALANVAHAACSFGASGEPSLQQSFNSLYGAAVAFAGTPDFAVLVRGVEPIPLAAVGWLLNSAFAGLATRRPTPHSSA